MRASLRLIGDFRCVWIDANGYCKVWILREKRVNVIDNPLLCVACPLYTPSTYLSRGVRRDKIRSILRDYV
jgi:hypothetical protein